MDIFKNIANGEYTPKSPFPSYKLPKDEIRRQRKIYKEEEEMLLRRFEYDLAAEYGFLEHVKRKNIFEKAWERGHSSGLNDVVNEYSNIAEILSW